MSGLPYSIDLIDLSLAAGFVLVAGLISLRWRLGLERDLAVGTVRCVVQLFLMGYLLQIIFRLKLIWLVLVVFLGMTAAAAQLIRGRVRERRVPYLAPTFLAMLVSYFLVSIAVTGVVLDARPWWEPRVFIPIVGMIIGNSMSALALALDRLFADLAARRELVEARLALGADYREASEDIFKDAIRAGMIPSINGLMGVGVVFLPGMMTGQILAGADPVLAIRYQIVVMLMLVASSALAAVIVVAISRRRCFGPGQAPLLRGPRT